jgi:hypothetical protein
MVSIVGARGEVIIEEATREELGLQPGRQSLFGADACRLLHQTGGRRSSAIILRVGSEVVVEKGL